MEMTVAFLQDMQLWASQPHLLPLAVDTLIFTFRMLAGTFAVILLGRWWRHRRQDEIPPYNRKRNDLAWAWAKGGIITGGISFTLFDLNYYPLRGDLVSDLFVLVVWWCFANAMTVRLSSKAVRPQCVYLSATIFIMGGFGYTLLVKM